MLYLKQAVIFMIKHDTFFSLTYLSTCDYHPVFKKQMPSSNQKSNNKALQ